MIGTAFVTDAFMGRFDKSYPFRVVAVLAVMWACRHSYKELDWGAFKRPWFGAAVGALVFVFWIALDKLLQKSSPAAIEAGLASLPTGSAFFWLLFRAVGMIVTVPFAEELAFRAYLPRRFASSDVDAVATSRFTPTGMIISSVAFGALHGRFLAGTLAGLCYALAVAKYKRLADAAIAHSTTNALIFVWVIAVQDFSLL